MKTTCPKCKRRLRVQKGKREDPTPIRGRREDPTPIRCAKCEWHGRQMDAVHTYQPDGIDDVEPVDECPDCGSDQLIPVKGRGT